MVHGRQFFNITVQNRKKTLISRRTLCSQSGMSCLVKTHLIRLCWA